MSSTCVNKERKVEKEKEGEEKEKEKKDERHSEWPFACVTCVTNRHRYSSRNRVIYRHTVEKRECRWSSLLCRQKHPHHQVEWVVRKEKMRLRWSAKQKECGWSCIQLPHNATSSLIKRTLLLTQSQASQWSLSLFLSLSQLATHEFSRVDATVDGGIIKGKANRHQ